ncbi:MAG: UPF0280 family protein, partial [Candidatus Adiutrix sp.]
KLRLTGAKEGFWGLCSSGFGGRSHTLGIADTALCIGKSAAVADGAATSLANACNINSPAISRKLAETIDPDTDIASLAVTTAVGPLSPEEIKAALASALQYGQKLVDGGLILGALISLRGQTVTTNGFSEKVATLEPA